MPIIKPKTVKQEGGRTTILGQHLHEGSVSRLCSTRDYNSEIRNSFSLSFSISLQRYTFRVGRKKTYVHGLDTTEENVTEKTS